MVAYSFQPGFAAEIIAGRKTQTIRNPRKRHAMPGEHLQLFTGMRTRYCKKIIPDPLCIGVDGPGPRTWRDAPGAAGNRT